MSDYRERCNEAKSKRAGIVDQRAQPNRNKKEKSVIVESRRHPRCPFPRLIAPEWRKWGAYRTVEEAQKVIALQGRRLSDLWEFRIKPD